MRKEFRDLIKSEFINCTKNTLDRVKSSINMKDAGGNYKPFHDAILIPEAILWSKFERSFSTSFGQRLIEEVSLIVAKAYGATSTSHQKETIIKIPKEINEAIEKHIQEIKEGNIRGDWKNDISQISSIKTNKEFHVAKIISDLWFERDGKEYFFSIKTVKPNIDQTLEAKRDLLKIWFSNKNSKVYYGLYYNPWGENRADYSHNPPMKVFNFHKDEVVLIGKDYWDMIGKSGTYEILLEIAKEAGKETKIIVETFSKEISK